MTVGICHWTKNGYIIGADKQVEYIGMKLTDTKVLELTDDHGDLCHVVVAGDGSLFDALANDALPPIPEDYAGLYAWWKEHLRPLLQENEWEAHLLVATKSYYAVMANSGLIKGTPGQVLTIGSGAEFAMAAWRTAEYLPAVGPKLRARAALQVAQDLAPGCGRGMDLCYTGDFDV